MTDHLPECPWPEKPCGPDHEPMHDRQPLFCTACLTECDCERLRACEQRVLETAIAAVREAIGTEWNGEIVPKGEYDCCGCRSYSGIVNDATDAIRALKEKP